MSRRYLLVHELRVLARSRTAAVSLTLLAILVAYGTQNGVRWVRGQQATIERLQEADRRKAGEIVAQLGDLARHGNPRPDLQLAGMAWYIFQPQGAVAPAPHIDPRRAEAAASEWVGARHAVLPHAPLAALAVGQSDLHPFYSRVSIRTPPVLVNSDEIENPLNLMTGRFDLAFVLTFCWPLLVLPLVYNVLSEDRENGTLALVASQPVSLRVLLALRLGVRVGIAVAVTILSGLVTLIPTGAISGPAAAGLVLSAFAVAALGLFWAGVAAAVNVAGWRSATNATLITALWLLLTITFPAVIAEVASAAEPVPSRMQLIEEIRAAGNLRPAEVAALVTTYYEEHPDALPSSQSADASAMRGLAQQSEVMRRIESIVATYRQSMARQQQLADTFRFASPPLVIYEALSELAGTTTARFRQFNEQLDDYHRLWRAYFSSLVHRGVSLTPAHYEQAPRFQFREQPGARERRAATLISASAAIGLILLSAALLSVTRSRVTIAAVGSSV